MSQRSGHQRGADSVESQTRSRGRRSIGPTLRTLGPGGGAILGPTPGRLPTSCTATGRGTALWEGESSASKKHRD
eukprot:1210564-Pyramimonas_sp.AAC.1